MRTVIAIALSALFLASAPLLYHGETTLFALFAVVLAVLVAVVIEGKLTPLGLVFGAAGALGFTLLWPISSMLAGGALFGALFTPRSFRAPGSWRGLILHIAIAIAGGGAALGIVATYLYHEPFEWLVAVGVGSLVAAAPWLLRVDNVVAGSLDTLAQMNHGAARCRLERAAVLSREVELRRADVPRKEMRRIDDVFSTLIRLGRARASASDTDAVVLDDSIAEHLSALEDGLRAIKVREAVMVSARYDAAQELRQENLGIEAEVEAYSDPTATIRHGEGVQSGS